MPGSLFHMPTYCSVIGNSSLSKTAESVTINKEKRLNERRIYEIFN